MDTLYYDGQCPLCIREIRLLDRISDGGLRLEDLHQLSDSQLPPDTSREQMLRRLHFRDHSGHWRLGLEATVASWSHTRYGWLFRPLLWPLLRPLCSNLYEFWANRRYCNRYGECAV